LNSNSYYGSNDSFVNVDQPSAQVTSLNQALTSFKTDISPWKEPLKWIEADEENITSIIQTAVHSLENENIRQASFAGKVMVYPRLIAYIFIHLTQSPGNESLLDQFTQFLDQWKTWDGVTIIQNHQIIKDYLWGVCQQGLSIDPRTPFLADFQKLLVLSAVGLCAHLAVTVMDRTKYGEFINRRGKGAQALVNLLQARLDFPVDPEFKSRHVKMLIGMCRASGSYPECLVLSGVELKGNSVAAGGFGDVYKGEIKGPGQKKDLAIKVLKVYQDSNTEKIIKSFVTEAVTWKQLSHPNVLPIYGIYHLDDVRQKVCFACPWMENGNIVKFLSQPENSSIDCVPLALDVAKGLAYLHRQRVVHGDLKGLNILVSNSGRALLADFGLATMDTTTMMTFETNRGTGTLRWQAPELLGDVLDSGTEDTSQRNTTSTDVYAFAFVCYEMFTGNIPFMSAMKDMQVIRLVLDGKRPSRPSDERSSTRGLNDNIWHLIEQCWAQKSSDRPTAEQIVEYLHALPNRPSDLRPTDRFDFPSAFWGNQAKHPFSVLAYSTYMDTLGASGTVVDWTDSDNED
jgi:serine/threonine protein kinase